MKNYVRKNYINRINLSLFFVAIILIFIVLFLTSSHKNLNRKLSGNVNTKIIVTKKIINNSGIIQEAEFDESFFNYLTENSLVTKVDNDTYDLSQITNLIINNADLSSIDGIKYFDNLFYLEINHSTIKDFYIDNMPSIDNIRMDSENTIENLSITSLSNLKNIYLVGLDGRGCKITKSLKLENLENLSSVLISLYYSIDIDINISRLKKLYIMSNLSLKETSYDLISLPNLNISDETLASIENLVIQANTDINKINKASNLLSLVLNYNKMTAIDVSCFPKLNVLDLSYNPLLNEIKGLDKLVNLQEIHVRDTSLNKIDLSENTELGTTNIEKMIFGTVDITNNPFEGSVEVGNSINLEEIVSLPSIITCKMDENDIFSLNGNVVTAKNEGMIYADCTYMTSDAIMSGPGLSTGLVSRDFKIKINSYIDKNNSKTETSKDDEKNSNKKTEQTKNTYRTYNGTKVITEDNSNNKKIYDDSLKDNNIITTKKSNKKIIIRESKYSKILLYVGCLSLIILSIIELVIILFLIKKFLKTDKI